MRKLIRSRRGDISAPVITILLVIASISIAALVISWLFGVGIASSKQSMIVISGTPIVQQTSTGYTLYITVRNIGNVAVNVTGVILFIPVGTTTPTSTITTTATLSTSTLNSVILPGETKQLQYTFSASPAKIGVSRIDGLLLTTAGQIPFSASLLG